MGASILRHRSDFGLGLIGVSLALKTTDTVLKSLLRRIRSKRSAVVVDTSGATNGRDQIARQLPDATPAQVEIIASVSEQTMTSPERILALCNAVDYLVENRIAGDIVECGVWRGGSMASVAKTLMQHGADHRTLWMYDTYDGMSEPTAEDVDFQGYSAESLMAQQARSDAKSVWCCSPLDQVKLTMAETGYPTEAIRFVEGKVEETLPDYQPDKIALLRLDTDWYESTRCELEYLFPKLVPGGVLIIDDYGHWEGCRRAVDEYFQKNSIPMLLNRIDYTGRIGIHCPATST